MFKRRGKIRLQRTELRTALNTFSVMSVKAHSLGQRQTRSVRKVEVPWKAFYSLGYLHDTASHHSANLHGKECLNNLVTSAALACRLKIVLIGMTKLYCSETPTIPQECRGFIHVKSFVRSAMRSHGEGSHGSRAHRAAAHDGIECGCARSPRCAHCSTRRDETLAGPWARQVHPRLTSRYAPL